MNLRLFTWVCAGLALAASPSVAEDASATLRQLDADHKEAVSRVDIATLEAMAHPNLRINAPTGRILTRESFLADMRSGAIRAETFERVAEEVVVSGDLGVVMGRETFTPAATSDLGKVYGARPLQRRYTNVYRLENGRWLWIARHANVVGER